jgi:predicted RND superfamily exporter protein
MAAICALFMSNLFVVCVTTGVIASIFVETLGLMALMGMSVDPVVMAAVIIAIGFSVDIPAHVSYHFHMAKWAEEGERRGKVPRSVEERVSRAFSSVGFPALQASICEWGSSTRQCNANEWPPFRQGTNTCIAVLLIVPLYMAQVFVRVLCTCLTLCTIHSLLLLPALFSLVANVESFFQGQEGHSEGNVQRREDRRKHSIRI